MRARSRIITTSSGAKFETPLLVPSFSSRGFAALPHGRASTRPASWVHTHTFAPIIDEALLLSAHDIHHKLVDDADALEADASHSLYGAARLLFIDSGLYESREDSDVYEPLSYEASPSEWTEQLFTELIDSLSLSGPELVVVSWDRYAKHGEQIARAVEFFGERKELISVFLLKPEAERSFYDLNSLRPHIADLRAFDIIGVTEKELGASVVDRLVSTARLRADLDAEGVGAPIHVFGSLDPLYTPLYFAFGAEVFDGLAWLRYGFHDDLLVHRDAVPLLKRDVDEKLQRAANTTQASNLAELRRLKRNLVKYVETAGSWASFIQQGPLSHAYEDADSERKKKGIT